MDLTKDGVINPEEWLALVHRNPDVIAFMTLPASVVGAPQPSPTGRHTLLWGVGVSRRLAPAGAAGPAHDSADPCRRCAGSLLQVLTEVCQRFPTPTKVQRQASKQWQ